MLLLALRESGQFTLHKSTTVICVANTTATGNTAVGGLAMGLNTTGDGNVAVGLYAMQTNTTGASNIAIGRESLKLNTTGSKNTSIGRTALNNCTTGYENVSVGHESSYNGVSLTTGYKNTIIGTYAKTSAVDGTNQNVIGWDVTGSGNNTFTFGNGSTDTTCTNGGTSWSAPSDQRLKEEITTATAGLSFVNDLRPVTFKWKKEKDIPTDLAGYKEGSETRFKTDTTEHGFIAQEVKTAIDAHSEIKDGFDMWSADDLDGRQRIGDTSLIPMLVKAIQELSLTLAEASYNRPRGITQE